MASILMASDLLHLDDVADLARTSAVCASFRRVVSDGRFLRRFSSIHRRPVLGLLDNRHDDIGFHPAERPHSSAPAAAALVNAADLAFSSLPDPSGWRVCDVRDGRVLLSRCARWNIFDIAGLVVYDPLHRRRVDIPPIPGELLAVSSADQHGGRRLEPFLAPAANEEGEEEDDELSFRVMCNKLSKTMVVTFVFSSASGQWQGVTSFSNPKYNWMDLPLVWVRHCARRCFYWTNDFYDFMLMLDICEMKFSIVDLPRKSNHQLRVVTEAGEGRLGLLLVGEYTINLFSKAWGGNGGAITEEWQQRSNNIIPMHHYHWNLAGAAEGYVLLRGLPRHHYGLYNRYPEEKQEAHYFTVELKTLKVERLCVLNRDNNLKFLYASFPPPFSPLSI